jgi:type I restriction enzyme M protein
VIYNLDSKNLSSKQDFERKPPEVLVDDIIAKEQRIAALMAEIKQTLARGLEDGKRAKEISHGQA